MIYREGKLAGLVLVIVGLIAGLRLGPQVIIAQACAGFYDDFTGSALPSGWYWINEDRWSLSERVGFLRILTRQTEEVPTYLLRDAGDVVQEAWTHLAMDPTNNLQQAGLVLYQDEDHWLRLTRQSLGEQALFVWTRRLGEDLQIRFVFVEEAVAIAALRIRWQEGEWVAEYAAVSGSSPPAWVTVGQFEADLIHPQVGLMVTTGEHREAPVDFDDFCLVGSEQPTPTPAGTTDLELRGWVYNAAADPPHPVPRAVITLLTCRERLFQIRVQADGRYVLRVPGTALRPCEDVQIEVMAPGYQKYVQTFLVPALYAQPQQDFGLMPALLPQRTYLPLLQKSLSLTAPPGG